MYMPTSSTTHFIIIFLSTMTVRREIPHAETGESGNECQTDRAFIWLNQKSKWRTPDAKIQCELFHSFVSLINSHHKNKSIEIHDWIFILAAVHSAHHSPHQFFHQFKCTSSCQLLLSSCLSLILIYRNSLGQEPRPTQSFNKDGQYMCAGVHELTNGRPI